MQESSNEDLVDALQDATRGLTALALQSLAAADGVGLQQMRLLFAVGDDSDRSCAELAAALGISASSVTRQADRLVHSGHLLRRQNPANRSVVMLELTKRGRCVLQEVLAWRRGVFLRATAELDADARAEVTSALRLVHAALLREAAARQVGGPSPGPAAPGDRSRSSRATAGSGRTADTADSSG